MKHAALVGLIAGALLCVTLSPPAYAEPTPSLKTLTKAAEQGDKAAMYALGMRYLNGDGVAKDTHAAFHWFSKTVYGPAASGYAPAEYELGKASQTGDGLERNLPAAYTWYSLAAQFDPQYAQYASAVEARMTPLELAQGRYKLAADLTDGVGAPANQPAALKLMKLAAEPGYREAQSMVGYMYDQGLGTPVDRAEAVRWYRMAADQDWATAQNNLGAMYEMGLGVPVDLVEAWKWYFLSARTQSYYAPGRRHIETLMTPEQIAEGKARADAWRPVAVIQSLLNPGGAWP